jgi:hypothetical protein
MPSPLGANISVDRLDGSSIPIAIPVAICHPGREVMFAAAFWWERTGRPWLGRFSKKSGMFFLRGSHHNRYSVHPPCPLPRAEGASEASSLRPLWTAFFLGRQLLPSTFTIRQHEIRRQWLEHCESHALLAFWLRVLRAPRPGLLGRRGSGNEAVTFSKSPRGQQRISQASPGAVVWASRSAAPTPPPNLLTAPPNLLPAAPPNLPPAAPPNLPARPGTPNLAPAAPPNLPARPSTLAVPRGRSVTSCLNPSGPPPKPGS